MPRTYNHIYKLLVTNEKDVVGHVAYALYKLSKIEYIEKFKESHGGTLPTDADLQPFHDISCTPSSIDRYKTKAVEISRNFLDTTLAETVKQIEKDYVTTQDRRLESIIEPLKPMDKKNQFWRGVWQSVLGAFFFAIIVAAFVFITTFNKADDSVKAGKQVEHFFSSEQQQPEDTPFDTVQTEYIRQTEE